MIDSFSAAVASAEEALRDPGGLRFTYLPSLVAFVDAVRAEESPADWGPDEVMAGVRLCRRLLELGLRGEAGRLFDELRGYLARSLITSPADVAGPANALAAVGAALGRLTDARALLHAVVQAGEAEDGLLLTTLANLAVLELGRGEPAWASRHVRSARRLLSEDNPAELREIHRVLATVNLRLARATGRRGEARLYTGLAYVVRKMIQERGGDSPEAFLAVAHLAVARAEGAVLSGDQDTLESALTALEVAVQRLAALLGADHPKVLVVRADLAAVQVEAARAARSAARLERAVGALRSVVERLETRLGPAHPRSVAALANLVTAQVESVVAAQEPGKAERTAESLARQAARSGRVLGEGHPVTRLVRASSATCRRMATGEDDGTGAGSTMLLTLRESPGEWETDSGAYRAFEEGMRELGGFPPLSEADLGIVQPRGPRPLTARQVMTAYASPEFPTALYHPDDPTRKRAGFVLDLARINQRVNPDTLSVGWRLVTRLPGAHKSY
ncbi:hypothetical protein [Streptomyces flavalbus]|uniref:Tetratricopeptide repeat protein n=1 Tax=Streptomyces flavalbus TaxID=2665155 RepID=A0ABW2WHT5_9ACTN